MIALWGSDDDSSCLSPLGYLEASRNFLEALKLLSGKDLPSPDDPTATTHAIEFEKHRNFFVRMDGLEAKYHYCYPFELKARRDIVLKGVLFNHDVYALEVMMRLNLRGPLHSPLKHSSDTETRLAKVPRPAPRSDAVPARSSSSFRARPPACLLCGKGHQYREHPTNVTMFDNNKPLFSRLKDDGIWTAKPWKGSSSKHICTRYNLKSFCDGRHGTDSVHVCSLCGGQHAALDRNNSCDRVFDGYIQA